MMLLLPPLLELESFLHGPLANRMTRGIARLLSMGFDLHLDEDAK